MEKELLANAIQIQGQLKVLHWQTESYAEHKAFGKIYESLGDRIDRLIEVYSGKYQRPKFGGVKQLTFADYDNLKIDAFLESFEDFMNNSFMAQQDAELNNIKDEIVADIQKLKYLLTLK
jgi:DNA-binding ferritin-like protein